MKSAGMIHNVIYLINIYIFSDRAGIWVNREISPELKSRYLSEFSVGVPGAGWTDVGQQEFLDFRRKILNRRGRNFPKNFVQLLNDESIKLSRLILSPAVEPQIAYIRQNILSITLEFCHSRLVTIRYSLE